VAAKSVLLDANILVRAVLGRRVRDLVERYAQVVEFVAPDVAFTEAEEHLPTIFAKRGLPSELAMASYEHVVAMILELPLPYYAGQEAAARAR
jgi:hypothetical protein